MPASTTLPPVPIDIAGRAFKADPYPTYARLRDEMPVAPVVLPDRRRAWLVTRYDDVLAALKDPRLVKDRRVALTAEQVRREPWMPAMVRPLTRNMLDLDGADHLRLRGLVHKAFTPRLVERMRDRVQALADARLEAALARGAMDVIADYAEPIPTAIIADMLAVPAGDQGRFRRWSSGIVQATASRWGMLPALPHLYFFLRYIRRLIADRRRALGDDLLSALVAAEESGDQMSEDELVAMVFLLLVAGHETTVNLIGNGTLALLEHPEAYARLRAEPELVRTGVEELLRYYSPVEMATERFAREAVEVAGVTIPRGALVLAVLASANRDPRQFPDADTLDLAREPNRHVAFGHGVHYCLGAPLARLEGQIAIGSLVARFGALRLAVPRDRLRWRPGLVVRGLARLPVRVG